MIEVLSTRDFEPRERLGYWNDVIGSTYDGMVVDSRHEGFDARLSVWQLADLRMVRPFSRPAVITRNERRAAMPTRRTLVAHVVTAGRAKLEQRGRSAIVGEGDMVICAAEEFYRFDAATTHEMMVVELDHAILSGRLPDIDDHVARTVSGKLPGMRLVYRHMHSLWQEASQPMPPAHWQAHATILADMIAACLGNCGERLESSWDPLLNRVDEVIADRLADFDLTPAMIAADTGVPLRSLQAAAARAGTTLGQLIADRRLQRAARLLSSGPETSVTEIALDCGFADPSYFARRFQQRFGVSPSRYRICH